MKTKNLTIIGLAIFLFASCASSKDLTYDDDVYGDFQPKVYAGTETSDEYFENEDYYNEEYAKENSNDANYSNSNVNYGNQNNYYYGGSGYNSNNYNNCGCNCNSNWNNSYYGNSYYNNGFGCGNNFYGYNNYYSNYYNPYNNYYGYNYYPGIGYGVGIGYGNSYYNNGYYGNGYGYNNSYYNNGYYNNGYYNNGYVSDNSSNTTVTTHHGGGMSSSSTNASNNQGSSTDLYNLTTPNVKMKKLSGTPSTNSGNITNSENKPQKEIATFKPSKVQNFNNSLSGISSQKPIGHTNTVSKPIAKPVIVNTNVPSKEIIKNNNTYRGNNNVKPSAWGTAKPTYNAVPSNSKPINNSNNYYKPNYNNSSKPTYNGGSTKPTYNSVPSNAKSPRGGTFKGGSNNGYKPSATPSKPSGNSFGGSRSSGSSFGGSKSGSSSPKTTSSPRGGR